MKTIGLFLAMAGCAKAPQIAPMVTAVPTQTEVVFLGAIHSGHLTTEGYNIQVLQDLIRRIDPDVACIEVPPDRLPIALAQYRETGQVTEPRTVLFPEYTQGLFPLIDELDLTVEACAGWTQTMADGRREALAQLVLERPGDNDTMDAATEAADQTISSQELDQSPWGVHQPAYDEAVRQGMAPYVQLYTLADGPGDWQTINEAHWRLISTSLEAHRGERVLVIFGAWHKYWFIDRAAEDASLNNRSVLEFLPAK